MLRTLIGLLVVSLLVGCSSMRVVSDYSASADFSQFKTFQYKDNNNNLISVNPLAHDRIVTAIKREANGRGLLEAEENPDVYISYYASVTQEVVLNTSSTGYGMASSWTWGATSSTTRVSTYNRGTIVIDIWRAEEKELVWRGTVSDILSDRPDRNADAIDRGIAAAFQHYPPRSSR